MFVSYIIVWIQEKIYSFEENVSRETGTSAIDSFFFAGLAGFWLFMSNQINNSLKKE